MKKAIGLVVLALAVVCGAARAQFNTPSLGDGTYTSPLTAPCVPYEVGPSTGTTEVPIVGTGLAGITTTTPGWVNWVAVGTGTWNSYLVLKDTGTTGSSLNTLTGRVMFATSTVSGTTSGSYYSQYQVYEYIPPVEFTKGLTVQANGCTGGCWATVCYRTTAKQSQ